MNKFNEHYYKILRILLSCNDIKQIASVERMVDNYRNRFKFLEEELNDRILFLEERIWVRKTIIEYKNKNR